MRGLRWSKIAAATVFVLIAVLVLSGMTWATVATFELTKVNVREQRRTMTLRAVNLMDSYIGGILNSESARKYTDYVAFFRPQAIWSVEGARLPSDPYLLRSPLVAPPHRWIDLYFHVEAGRWSSPQIPDEAAPWTVACVVPAEITLRRLRNMLEWLGSALPAADLHERVVEALERERSLSAPASASHTSEVIPVAQQPPGSPRPAHVHASTEYRKRKSGHRESQIRYLPAEQCIALQENADFEDSPADVVAAGAGESSPGVEQVGLSCSEFSPPFWLDAPSGDGLKMAFVRECYEGAEVRHQGFLGDWDKLKPELLKLIDHLFPQADLEPIHDEDALVAAHSETKMSNLPVRLVVPGIPGGVAAAAWRSIRVNLIASWAAAAAVLVVAGFGLRNLVALTERRMQFAYAVTHELRTPLTTFRLYADMLSAGIVPDRSRQEYLDTLNRESQRLSRLVEGVLEYARLENQKVKLNPTETDAASLLDSVSGNLEKRCHEFGIKPRTENALSNGKRLQTDVDVVNRIAGVLVHNACRYARDSSDAAVLVRLGEEDGNVYLDIVDSGPGVERADARAIFKPFRRGRGATQTAQGGIGLGLALASSWAGLLGGRLELVARHHPQMGGAHFRLTIPVHRV